MRIRKAWYIAAIMLTCVAILLATLAIVARMDSRLITVSNSNAQSTLHPGTLAITRNAPTSHIQVGDIIVYTSQQGNGQVSVRRVIATPAIIGGDFFQTKGDDTSIAEVPIHGSAITGRVAYVVPLAGYVVDFLRRPLGLALVAYVPALILLATQIRRLSLPDGEGEYLDPEFDPKHAPVRHFHLHHPH